MSMWDGRELERRTAARVAKAGFAPAINVIHADTRSEFDVYAFLPQPASLERLMVQCSVPRPNHEKLSALKGNASTFGADHMLYVTESMPHQDQCTLADTHGIELITEDGAGRGTASIAGTTIDVQATPTVREAAIRTHLQCLSWLRRVALDARSSSSACAALVDIWNRLNGVSLIEDPFERLLELYEIHYAAPKLAENCAVAEGLASTGRAALKRAYAYNGGSYTQSALAVQTLNRTHTLIAFCECACLVALGHAVPQALDDPVGRRGALLRWLAQRPSRHKLGIVAFEFVYGWGGLWSISGVDCAPHIANAVGISVADLHSMRGCVDHLLRSQGMGTFIKPVSYRTNEWEALALLPFYAKGIGIRRLELETGQQFNTETCMNWKQAFDHLRTECQQYETAH